MWYCIVHTSKFSQHIVHCIPQISAGAVGYAGVGFVRGVHDADNSCFYGFGSMESWLWSSGLSNRWEWDRGCKIWRWVALLLLLLLLLLCSTFSGLGECDDSSATDTEGEGNFDLSRSRGDGSGLVMEEVGCIWYRFYKSLDCGEFVGSLMGRWGREFYGALVRLIGVGGGDVGCSKVK
jgi:hypothetical protein